MSRGSVIHEGRNRLAALALDVPGRAGLEAVLKQFRPRGLDRLKTLFLPSKALKAWRGARALLDRGIPTPRPLAYLERRRAGMITEGYFLAEKLPNVREVRELFIALEGGDLDRLLRSLADFLRTCHDRGVLHRDLSDGNVLAAEDGRGGYVFHLLDTNRVRVVKRVAGRRAASNLVRLGIPRESRRTFLSYYGAGRAPGRFFALWYGFRKSWYASWVRVKKALRLRALARKLGVQ
ncbi:MAG: hypothetical protein A2Y56_08135 [Candidatus Aminicenantes bacterium RBG_13_63_10]|nr:MAG: hypothetical protein A2Y56_08135 [Candidatus Aminicenantes bacterium RBG_13_63_10]